MFNKEFFQKNFNLANLIALVAVIAAFAFYIRSERAIARAEQTELIIGFRTTLNQTNAYLSKITFPDNKTQLSLIGKGLKQLGYNISFDAPIVKSDTTNK